MNSQRPAIMLLVTVYVFSPSLLSWILNPHGTWYRPYFIWAIIIVIAYLISGHKKKHEL